MPTVPTTPPLRSRRIRALVAAITLALVGGCDVEREDLENQEGAVKTGPESGDDDFCGRGLSNNDNCECVMGFTVCVEIRDYPELAPVFVPPPPAGNSPSRPSEPEVTPAAQPEATAPQEESRGTSTDEEWGEDGCEEIFEEMEEKGLAANVLGCGGNDLGGNSPRQGAPGSKPWVNTQFTPAPGLVSKGAGSPPDQQWARAEVIAMLKAAGEQWARRYPSGPRIQIGDISRKGGGHFPNHKSHHEGLDVDIRLFRKDGREGPVNLLEEPQLYDRDRTRELIDLLRDVSGRNLDFVMLDDDDLITERLVIPTYRRTAKNPVPRKDHVRHLHVRFK